jgi:gentisate 1,2-dioxygenase
MSSHDAELEHAWKAANLSPLWQSPTAHKPPPPPDPAQHWSWQALQPLLQEAMKITSPEAVERRVLLLLGGMPRGPEDEATVRSLSAGIQMLLPGERARPHRHTMNALRFVLSGSGATTLVDGKECSMEVGDLVLTPAWTWHEHVHQGKEPVLWLDVLDVPLHLWFGNVAFQPGPINDGPVTVPDAAFSSPNVVPVMKIERPYSPLFRFPYADAARAVAHAPVMPDGSRRVRYANPLTGGSAMCLMDASLMRLEKGRSTLRTKTNANAVCCVVKGKGESHIGSKTIYWRANDIFTLPQHNIIRHTALSDEADILVVSDRDALSRLGILKDELCGEAAYG